MSRLTRTGAMMGTPIYMAPEQHKGERADERCDQFAFSVALYHALYGDWPFPGKTTVALADAVIEGKLQDPPRGHRVPSRLRRILLRGLRTDPNDRYPTMDALLADLTRRPRRRLRAAAILTGVVAIVALALGEVYRSQSPSYRLPARERAVPTFDPKALPPDRGIAWLSQAIERGQLDDALEKYDMAAALQERSGAQVQASIARSTGALVLALRGHFAKARERLREANAGKGTNSVAIAYADLAAAALAFGSGDLGTAATQSASCAVGFATAAPELSAMCLEVVGDTAAARGDLAAARAAYRDGLAVAHRIASPQRVMTLQLAVAALDLDAGMYDAVVAKAAELQAEASERGATSSEQQAWVLLARGHLAQAASQKALEDLDHVKGTIATGAPETSRAKNAAGMIEPIHIRLEHRIALGQTYALLGDADEGKRHLEQARAEADRLGAPGLSLEARLARLDVDFAIAAEDALGDATAAQRQLVADAQRIGYGRIARLAETAGER